MLFRVIFSLDNKPFITIKQTLDNLREDAITARVAHLIQYIEIGETFTIVHADGKEYIVIRVA